MLIYIFMFLFIMSLISFSINRKHLLSLLLSLELIMLMLFLMLVFYFSFLKFDSYFLMIFLTFAVCEGSLGLSILVSMVRTHGNDYFSSFNLLW